MVVLLIRKMLRDIRRSGTAYAICMVVVAIGFCGYCVLSVASDHLSVSRDLLYESCSFADGFAEVHEAPDWMAEELEQIPGIERAEARIVKEAGLAEEEETSLLLISYRRDGLNRPLLFRGIDGIEGAMQLVPGNAFLEARNLKIGDSLELLISGKRASFEITGGGISPENIYMIKNIVDMLPDAASYDAGFVSYETMEMIYSMEHRANSFVFTLADGYELSDVKAAVEDLLEPYGCSRVYGREDHLSASMLDTELDQLGKTAGAMPLLFLSVAAIILYITMSRLIDQQRIQIGTMLSIGISGKTIGLHYMGYGLFLGAAGGMAGGILGNVCADPLVDYYRTYFNLPEVFVPISFRYLFLGICMAGIFCGGVTWICARNIISLSPSEALRPPAPRSAKAGWLERIPGFLSLFTVPGIMAVRSIGRNRKRSVLSLIGIACAFMITATLVSMNTLFDVFLFDYLEKVQGQDYTVYFEELTDSRLAMEAVQGMDIELAEPVLEVPVKLRYGQQELDGTIQAIQTDSSLCRLWDQQERPVYVGEEGMVLSVHMASLLGVSRGDWLEAELSYPYRHLVRIQVTGLMEQYLGSTAYMSMDGLGAVSEYRNVCTGLLLKASPGAEEELKAVLEDAPNVTGIESRHGKLMKWRSMMGSFELIMGTMVVMGILIGLAVLYTSALISFEEMKRELSVLLMLGLMPAQCLEVISVSQWILTLGGILLGIPLTLIASRGLSVSMTTELYSLPDFVDAGSVVLSVILVSVAVYLSNYLILRKLKEISPVALLMERE